MAETANAESTQGGSEITSYWTGVSNAIASSLTPVAESAAQAAARYQEVGRRMTDLAADYARGLQQTAEGIGNAIERQAVQQQAARIDQAITTIRQTGIDAYAKYGEAVATAAREGARASLANIGGAVVDGVSLGIRVAEATQNADWKAVGETAA